MTRIVEAAGAPFDQGVAQGVALEREIRELRRELRARFGPFAWYGACRRARRRAAVPMQRFLPQMHERLRGIADGARIDVRALELHDTVERVAGVGSLDGKLLEGRFDPARSTGLFVRRSRPDAVGFASVELTAPGFTGCLAGVNEQGVAALVLDEIGSHGPSLRCYAQDLIMRAPDAEAGARHFRLRARYGGGDGALLLADAAGRAYRLELRGGVLEEHPLSPVAAPAGESTVTIDSVERVLRFAAETVALDP